MAADDRVTIECTLNDDDFRRVMGGMPNTANQGFHKTLAVYDFFKASVTKIWNMIADSVSSAMNRIDTMDQFSRVMTTMLGSTEKANSALEKTSEIVKGTAFGLDVAAQGVQAFVASGMEVEKATDTMGAWADAVAFYTKGSNEELGTVSTALQKMQTKGTVTMEHLQMLLEAGIPAVEIYASAVGMSTDEVTEAMSKGELSTSDFISAMNDAFNNGTTKFPKIAGAAKEAGASWKGSMDNMKAAVTRGVGSCLQSFDQLFNVKSGMVSFGKAIEQVLKFIGENMKTIAPIALGAAGAFAAFKTVSAVFSAMRSTIFADCRSLKDIFTVLKMSIQDGVKGINNALATMSTATIIGAVIAAVVALIGIIDSLSNTMDGYQKKLEASNKRAKEQAETNQQLIDSMSTLDNEYEKNTHGIEEAASKNRDLIERITELKQNIDSGTASESDMNAMHREMSSLTQELSQNVDGLSLEYDSATNSLNKNVDTLYQAVDAQEEYSKAVALMEHSASVIEKQSQIEDEIYMTKSRLADKQKELNDLTGASSELFNKSIIDIWDWGKASKETADNAEELKNQLDELSEMQKVLAEQARAETQEALNSMTEQMNKSGELTDNEIANINTLIEQGGEMSDADTEKFRTLEQNRARAKVAEADYIKAIQEGQVLITQAEAEALETRRLNGEELNEIERAKLDRWNQIAQEWQKSVSDHTDNVINNWEKLPDEYDKSLDEMIQIAQDNAARYGEWSDKMAYLSQHMSEESVNYLRELGPGAISVIDELIEGGSSKMQEFDSAVTGAAKGTAENAANNFSTISPSMIETFNELNSASGLYMNEFGDILNKHSGEAIASASEILSGTELPESVSAAMEATKAALQEKGAENTEVASQTAMDAANANVDGYVNTVTERVPEVTQAGTDTAAQYGAAISESSAPQEAAQAVTDRVTETFNNADYSGITKGITDAVKKGTKGAESAVKSLSTALLNVVKQMSQQITSEAKRMMSQIQQAINSDRGGVVNVMQSVMTSAKAKATEIASQFNTVGQKIIEQTRNAINSGKESVVSTAKNVIDSAKTSATNAANQFNTVRQKIIEQTKNAINSGKESVVSTAKNVIDSAKTSATNAASQFNTVGQKITEQIKNAIESNKGGVSNAISNAISGAKTSAETAASGFSSVGSSITSAIASGISSQAVSSAISNVVKSGTGVNVKGIGYESLGANIAEGIASGIRSSNAVANAVSNTVSSGVSAGKQKAKVNSPSKLFGAELGSPIAEGIALYIEKGIPDTVASVKHMISAMADVDTSEYDRLMQINKAAQAGLASNITAKGLQSAALNNITPSGSGRASRAPGVVNNFEQNNTIVNPPTTPSQAYRKTRAEGRRLLRELG